VSENSLALRSSRLIPPAGCDHCQALLFFESTTCLKCGHVLAFLPDLRRVAALESTQGNEWRRVGDEKMGRRYRLCANWFPVTFVLNNLNRSMGLPDGYPFVLSAEVINKLRFIHETIQEHRRACADAPGRGPA
jgi:hypothetical protein